MKKPKKERMWKAMSMRLPMELFKRIQQAANDDRRSVASWIRVAIEDQLKKGGV